MNDGVKIELSLEPTDQVFTYEHHDTRELLHFDVSLLRRIYQQAPKLFLRVTIDVTPEIYAMVMKYRGIEEPKVDALTDAQLQEPGFAVIFAGDASVTVDGHHRLVKRYRNGFRDMTFLYTASEVWRLCLLPATAEEIANIREITPPSPEHKMTVGSRAIIHIPARLAGDHND